MTQRAKESKKIETYAKTKCSFRQAIAWVSYSKPMAAKTNVPKRCLNGGGRVVSVARSVALTAIVP